LPVLLGAGPGKNQGPSPSWVKISGHPHGELKITPQSLYSLFWGLNMKLVNVGDVKKIDDKALNKHDKEKKGFFGKLGELVKKAIDCCIE